MNALDIADAWNDLDGIQHQYPPPGPPPVTSRGWMPASPDKFEHTVAEITRSPSTAVT